MDAATGGKTGINFLGLKNEIGVFSPADEVLINVDFFRSLDAPNLRSGYAEMVKHALIDTREEWNEILKFDLENPDFVMVSKGFGVEAERVDKREDLDAALKRMISSDKPYLLDIRVEKEQNVFPMVPSGASVSDIRLE